MNVVCALNFLIHLLVRDFLFHGWLFVCGLSFCLFVSCIREILLLGPSGKNKTWVLLQSRLKYILRLLWFTKIFIVPHRVLSGYTLH